jgi:hypothetical protein
MPTDTEAQQDQLQCMQGIANTLANSQLNVLGIEKLKQYLTQLDFRRNTSWQDQFSWLNQDFSI